MDFGEDGEGDTKRLRCTNCGHIGLEESDGFYYCQSCYHRAEDIVLTGVADEDFVDKGGGEGALYSARHTRRTAATQATPLSLAWKRFTQDEEAPTTTHQGPAIKIESFDDDADGPRDPEDFGSLRVEDYYNEVRMRYVMGLQWMLNLQCEALVQKFNVSPLICGIAGSVWLRYVANTGVFKDNWAEDIFNESESFPPGRESRVRHPKEPHNEYGQRAVMIWFRCLRKTIPLSSSLAISFLACHIAREAVLPTDITKWSLEGKLPYFAAYIEIEERFGRPSAACPISSSLMFRPYQAFPTQKLESLAAIIAESVGLHLPPVNFFKIASRYLKQLALPVENILPYACRIYEWSMPPDLWLSTSDCRLPTRVCILSILIVAIRILYNINGYGAWENSFISQKGPSESPCGIKMSVDTEIGSPLQVENLAETFTLKAPSDVLKPELGASDLLHNLEMKYNDNRDIYEYTKDLSSYLQYCKDVVFAGATMSSKDYDEEDELIKNLWNFYDNEKHSDCSGAKSCDGYNNKRSRDDDGFAKNQNGEKKIKEEYYESPFGDPSTCRSENIFTQNDLDSTPCSRGSQGNQNAENRTEATAETTKEQAVRRLKLDMEENRFCYAKPRVKLKRFDYLHYARKKDEGALTYVAHADYYILLRACARAAQVDARVMHIGVLSLERRLAWIEEKIDVCVQLTPPNITCKYCSEVQDQEKDDSCDLSKLRL